jgi:hypothetical protein
MSPCAAAAAHSRNKRLKQTNLFALSGVVVVEEIRRQNDRLNCADVDAEEKVRILRELAEKKPATEILVDSGIGRTVRRLAKSSAADVAREAGRVYAAWKAEVERREGLRARGPLEVRCDLDTRRRRDRARSAIADVVGAADLATRLEKALFDRCKHVTGGRAYDRGLRRIVRDLKEDSSSLSDLSRKGASVKTYVRERVR